MPSRSVGREADVSNPSFCPVAWLTIERGHPSLAGHFPQSPIVPAVLVLEHVVALAQGTAKTGSLAAIPVAKFMRPLRPGEEVLLGIDPTSPQSCRFVCRIAGETAAQGSFRIDTPAAR